MAPKSLLLERPFVRLSVRPSVVNFLFPSNFLQSRSDWTENWYIVRPWDGPAHIVSRLRFNDFQRSYSLRFRSMFGNYADCPCNRWMTSDFTSCSTVFQSYQNDGRMKTKCCVQWNPVYGWEDFASRGARTQDPKISKSMLNTLRYQGSDWHCMLCRCACGFGFFIGIFLTEL